MNIAQLNSDGLSRTQAEYIRRINRALAYINENIDTKISLDDVARESHFSMYHFHRLFHGMVGETVNDYVTRMRMEKAVRRVAYNSDMSITDIALAGGFSSSANFSKAFKAYFGVSPRELRNPQNVANLENSKIGKLYRKYGKEFKPSELYPQFVTNTVIFDPDKLKEFLMKVEVKEFPERTVAYLSSPGGYHLPSVYDTWVKIIDWGNKVGIDTDKPQRFALCHDNPSITPEDKCRYDAAIVIDESTNVVAPFQRSSVPAGKYAIAYYKDDASKINNFMTELCGTWFPDSGFEPDNHPPMFNYLNDTQKDGYVEMDVYIKIKELEVSE